MNFGDSASTLNGNVGRGLTIVLSTKEGGTAKKVWEQLFNST